MKEIIMPKLGLTMEEGTLVRWLVDEGDQVEKGQQIATIGPPPENGNWPPHLHFQIMLDLLDEEGWFE